MKKTKTARLTIPAVATGHVDLDTETPPTARGRVSHVARSLCRHVLAMLGNPPVSMVLWNGETIRTSADRPVARIQIRDRGALYKVVSNPNLHFGDLYSTGRIEVEGDLVRFLETLFRTAARMGRIGVLRRLHSRLLNRPRANTLAGSRHNIHHHYDLGNEFYRLWLDTAAMQYTCAYFPSTAMTLEEAQIAKMDHVCRKLWLKPGETVVEAGCGWGGLALYMAKNYGVKVRSYNISREQISYARERVKAESLDRQVEYIEDDYRNISGTYDAFVSVGMLEHVGPEHYRELGGVIHRCLAESGRGLIHTIGRNRPEKMNAWIEKRIFPGAYPPTLREMMDIFEAREFSVLDVENLRLHYATTLQHWLERFNRHADNVEKMFDRLFVRAWRLYLAGSIASFVTSSLQLFQVVFARETNNDVPWSREYMYRR